MVMKLTSRDIDYIVGSLIDDKIVKCFEYVVSKITSIIFDVRMSNLPGEGSRLLESVLLRFDWIEDAIHLDMSRLSDVQGVGLYYNEVKKSFDVVKGKFYVLTDALSAIIEKARRDVNLRVSMSIFGWYAINGTRDVGPEVEYVVVKYGEFISSLIEFTESLSMLCDKLLEMS